MTYKVDMNTATGHIKLIAAYEDADDMEFSDASIPKPTLNPQNQFNKKDLRSKFFELNISE